MHERVKQIRDHFDLSRAAFGERLGVSGDVINNIERGRVPMKELLISHLCDEYRVNEEWLRTGEGEMFIPMTQEEEIAEWVGRMQFNAAKGSKVDAMKQRLILALSHIDNDETWNDLYKIIKEVAKDD